MLNNLLREELDGLDKYEKELIEYILKELNKNNSQITLENKILGKIDTIMED